MAALPGEHEGSSHGRFGAWGVACGGWHPAPLTEIRREFRPFDTFAENVEELDAADDFVEIHSIEIPETPSKRFIDRRDVAVETHRSRALESRAAAAFHAWTAVT